MAWYGVITNSGKAALEQSLADEQVLDIDAVKLGTGTYTQAELYTATDVSGYCGDGSLGSKKAIDTGVRIIANIYALATEQLVKQVGIYGTINSQSVLLAIYQNDNGIDVPSSTQFDDYAYALSAIWDIDNIENLTITVDQTACVPYPVFNAQCDEYDAEIAGKVDKVQGKGLSTEDFTTAEKTKLAGIESMANRYVLPPATALTLGGVKAGHGLSVTSDGMLSVPGAPDYIGYYIGDGVGSSSPYKRKINLPFTPARVLIFCPSILNQDAIQLNAQDEYTLPTLVSFAPGQNYIHDECPATWATVTTEAEIEEYFEIGHGGAAVTTNGFYVAYKSLGGVKEVNAPNHWHMFFAWRTDPAIPANS